ncbi:hypothetical protein KIPB_008593 [Kipferlia bialata]|uniref:RWP-RK domain-containing protein n=1 Tax=Kipferlia bialata TaxID=797122 RepID=A0A9K3D2M1_9EUKA|nr:hypothetical protein KIPB_008593 [Kipferlia bialata]|eukprot:g8593.t1
MGRGKKKIELRDIQPFFNIPLREAARMLHISRTTLKLKCRELGIEQWPYRRQYSAADPKAAGCGSCSPSALALASVSPILPPMMSDTFSFPESSSQHPNSQLINLHYVATHNAALSPLHDGSAFTPQPQSPAGPSPSVTPSAYSPSVSCAPGSPDASLLDKGAMSVALNSIMNLTPFGNIADITLGGMAWGRTMLNSLVPSKADQKTPASVASPVASTAVSGDVPLCAGCSSNEPSFDY